MKLEKLASGEIADRQVALFRFPEYRCLLVVVLLRVKSRIENTSHAKREVLFRTASPALL